MNAAPTGAERGTRAGGVGTLGDCGATHVTLVLKGLGALTPSPPSPTPAAEGDP